VRLGVYSDLTYRFDGELLSNNRAFIRFVTSLPPRVDELVLFGRLDPEPGRSAYTLPSEAVGLVPLPYYPRVTHVRELLRSLRRSCAVFAAGLERLDAVWIFGPHPLALPFAWIARRKGVDLVLGIRQDYPAYIAGRLPSPWWAWAVPVAHALDLSFRLLATRAPTVVLGEELARRYRSGAPLLSAGFSLVPASEVVPLEEAVAKSWGDSELRLVSVSRLDPEKNPLLLLDVIHSLRQRDPRWRLTIAGDGPLRAQMESRAAALGLNGAVDLRGDVPNGPELWELYRNSHAFLHVSLTEGLPQVLFEAQAAGVPIVATAVGGVPEALAGGAAGLLVEPGDAAAAVDSLERLRADAELRRRLVTAAHEIARRETLEAQLDRVADFFRRELRPAPRDQGQQDGIVELEKTYRMERNKWDAIAEQEAAEAASLPPHADFADYARASGRVADGAAEFLGDLRAKRLLEYGCGLGKFTAVLAKSGADVAAFDISPTSIEVAERRLRLNELEADFTVAAGESLPYDDESFDIVVGIAVLHHLEVGQGSRELHRVLKPGGSALFVEPMGMNPLLNFARDHLPYRHKTPRGADEPLTYDDITAWGERFAEARRDELQLLSMVERLFGYGKRFPRLRRLDRALLARFPGLRRYCRYVTIYMVK
jgi:glycosyltransferase involved in cell wall biosynthesis/2-polyprenyl-3-methyl-5-hydroxy-6-metoxy-1,4-benzoquinol methylase